MMPSDFYALAGAVVMGAAMFACAVLLAFELANAPLYDADERPVDEDGA